jgi:rhodanese-related sulfurtransferase
MKEVKLRFFIGILSLITMFGSNARAKVESVDAKAAAQWEKSGQAVIIDVREESEISKGMATPALWLPMSRLKAKGKAYQSFVESLPKDKKLIFYCAVGGRAQSAATQFAELGYQTYNMGGFSDWKAAGNPTRTGP